MRSRHALLVALSLPRERLCGWVSLPVCGPGPAGLPALAGDRALDAA